MRVCNPNTRVKIKENGPYNIITLIDDLKDISRCHDLPLVFSFEAAVRRLFMKLLP